MRKILARGATSSIAQHTLRHFADKGASFYLVARDKDKLAAVIQDLETRGASSIHSHLADVLAFKEHASIIEAANTALDQFDTVFIAHGTLSDQETCERDYAEFEQEFRTNFLSIVSLLTPIATQFEHAGGGQIAVISSVAGDRGRKKNYAYGSAKAALDVFLGGLRNRLASYNVSVLTIKPGFVDTPMTAGFDKGSLFASPATVGASIFSAMQSKREVLYVPFFWRGIMAIIRAIPETVFKRLNI